MSAGDGNSGSKRGKPIISARGLVAALNRRPVAILLFVVAICRSAAMWHGLSVRFNPEDFSIFYCAAVTLHQGGNPYRTDMRPLARSLGLEKGYVEQINNPPTLVLLLEPLSLLQPHPAYWTWQAVNAIAFAAALFLLLWPGYSGLSGPMALSLAGFAIIFLPAGNDLSIAQSKMLALLPLVAMMRLMERKRDGFAGIMLGLTGLMHVFPLLLGGYLLMMRRWRAAAFTIGTILLGGIATLALMGVANSLSFFSAVGALASERWLSEPSNISLAAFVSRIVWSLSGGARGAWVELVRRASVVVGDLLVLYLVVKATDWRGGRDRDWRTFSLWVMAAVMVSPTAWFHYLLLMLIPFAQAASAANRGATSARAAWAMAATYLAISILGDVLEFVSHNAARLEQIRGLEFVCVLIAFVATYWFAVDLPEQTLDAELRASGAS